MVIHTASGIKYAFIIYPCSYFVNVYYLCGNSTRTLTIQNSVPVRVVCLTSRKVCGYPYGWFFYLCTNQTWHASDLSTLCRVFSTRCFGLWLSLQRVYFYLFSLL